MTWTLFLLPGVLMVAALLCLAAGLRLMGERPVPRHRTTPHVRTISRPYDAAKERM